MITAQREILVRSTQDEAWRFVQTIGNWANQMPGYMRHEENGPDDSVWFLNVHMGPFSRTIEVHVKVQRWLPGNGAEFTLKAPFEPFHGEGSFGLAAVANGTQVRMSLGTEVTGSMSQVLTAMAGPVLKKIADEFAGNLQKALGGAPDDAAATSIRQQPDRPSGGQPPAISWLERVRRWWKALNRRILRR